MSIDDVKRCIKCDQEKDIEQFSSLNRNSSGKINICKLCHNLSKKLWLLKNPEKLRSRREKCKAKAKIWRRNTRNTIINMYGGLCSCCRESNCLFLAIDHINGGGRTQRKELGINSIQIYKSIINGNFNKDDYRLLCHNCNSSLGYYGYCPHNGLCSIKDYKNNRSVEEHKRRVKARLSVIENYGGRCECCAENFMEFMTIDHKDNSGKQHREEIGINTIYFWLVKNNYPKDRYRLLCHNCNYARAHYGFCHEGIFENGN